MKRVSNVLGASARRRCGRQVQGYRASAGRTSPAAIGQACWELGHDCTELALADGGEGLLDALGGANRTTTVAGPLGTPVEAGWRLHRGTAIIEMARASGLVLAGGAEGNDPMAATTAGTGELIDAALDAGAQADHRRARRVGDDRRRARRAAGDQCAGPAAWRRAARRLRRDDHVRARGRGVRPPEGRHAGAGADAHRPAGAARRPVRRGVRRRRAGDSRARARRAGSPACSPRSADSSFRDSTSSPTSSVCTKRSRAPTS